MRATIQNIRTEGNEYQNMNECMNGRNELNVNNAIKSLDVDLNVDIM